MRCFETPWMRLEKSYTTRFLFCTLLGLLLCTPALGEEDRAVSLDQGFQRTRTVDSNEAFQRLRQAVKTAKALEKGAVRPDIVASVERAVEPVLAHLDFYPELGRTHGHEEPRWLVDRGDLTSQAVLALSALERVAPDPQRSTTLERLAWGLVYLQRKERNEYPFGAHISWQDRDPFAELSDGAQAPTALYRADRAYAVQALTEAGRVLSEPKFIESAKREALGMSTHLVIHGDLIRSFSPAPLYSGDIDDALPLVRGYLALHRATGDRIYSDLAALATRWDSPEASLSGPEWNEVIQSIEQTPSSVLLKAKPVGEPVTFQYIEAEEGRVVNKAIDTLDYLSSSGQPGRLAVMGRENTFWMRFDVPTEDDYLFDLSYLQSDVGGGLVSVMMRIDGDKIFQVPLGDVDGKPILRRAHVDGPRPLRAGPHSFGVRFSGLLMTKPALLDSVVVQPAVERREFALPDGQRLYLLRNVTDQSARVDEEHFLSWPPAASLVVDGEGQPARLGSSEDRRRRKQYATLPPYGVAVVRVDAPTQPELE